MVEHSRSATSNLLRGHAFEIAFTAAGFVLFVIFLAASFPYTDALSGMLAPLGLAVSSRDQVLSFPFGVRMNGVTVRAVTRPGSGVLFASERITVAPSLVSLLMGSPGVRVKAILYDGSVRFVMRQAGKGAYVNFDASGVRLERYPALEQIGIDLGGMISGTGELYLFPADITASHGSLRLAASNASVRLVRGMPSTRLGNVTAQVSLDHGNLVLRQLQGNGGDIGITAHGVIQLKPNLEDSMVAVKFELHPAPAARARTGFILRLLPHPPNATPYFLQGTLAAASVS